MRAYAEGDLGMVSTNTMDTDTSNKWIDRVSKQVNHREYIDYLERAITRMVTFLVDDSEDGGDSGDPMLDAFMTRERFVGLTDGTIDDINPWLIRLKDNGNVLRIAFFAEKCSSDDYQYSPVVKCTRAFREYRRAFIDGEPDSGDIQWWFGGFEFIQNAIMPCFANAFEQWYRNNPEQVRFYDELMAFERL